MALLAPHFDLPFRFNNGVAVVVEQDSYEDISNCVEAIVRTPVGFRVYDDRYDFGIQPPEFEDQPVDILSMQELVLAQEPRAVVIISEETNMLDTLMEKIKVEIWDTSDSQ